MSNTFNIKTIFKIILGIIKIVFRISFGIILFDQVLYKSHKLIVIKLSLYLSGNILKYDFCIVLFLLIISYKKY